MRLDRVSFEIDRVGVTIAEALAALFVGGHLDAAIRAARARERARREADDLGDDLTHEELQGLVNTWRSARRLSSADETRAWLEASGLELDAVTEHLRAVRLLERARERGLSPEEEEEQDAGQPPALVAGLLARVAEGAVIDGGMDGLLIVAQLDLAAAPPDEEEPLDAQRAAARLDLERRGGPAWLRAELGLDDAAIERLVERRAWWLHTRARVLTPEALEQRLTRDHRGLTRVEVVSAHFDAEAAAREAICYVRDEKKWLEPLGGEMGFTTHRSTRFVEDLPADRVGAQLATGRTGDVFSAPDPAGGFTVYEVVGRIEPALRDTEVRARVEARVLSQALAPLASRRIRAIIT